MAQQPASSNAVAKRARRDEPDWLSKLEQAESTCNELDSQLDKAFETEDRDEMRIQRLRDKLNDARKDKEWAQQMLLKSSSEAPRRFPSLPFPPSSRFPFPASPHYFVP